MLVVFRRALYTRDMAKKLGKTQRANRVVGSKLAGEARAATVKTATSRVAGKTQIDFSRTVRRK
jgi:hypothetical protein